MRKRVSLFMVIAILIGILPNTMVFGADQQLIETINFRKYDRALDKVREGAGLEERTPTQEETSLQWNMKTVGRYDLSYYIQDGLSTNHIELEFNVTGTGDITLSPSVTTKKDASPSALVPISRHKPPYTQGQGYELVAPGNTIALKLNSQVTSENELSFIANGLNVKLKIQGENITLTTNSVKKGNLTAFGLAFEDNLIGTINEFKGFEKFEILPTHLYLDGGVLKSKEGVDYPAEKPGSKPGVLAKFKRPRHIQGDLFEYMEDGDADKVNVALVLWPQFTIQGSQTDSTGSRNLQLRFSLGDSSNIVKDSSTPTSKTTVNLADDTIGVYISQDNTGLGGQVVEWDRLGESMLVGGNAVVDFEGETVYTPGVVAADYIGYTYLEFTPTKTGEEEVELEVQPYNINVPVTYKIFENRTTNETNWVMTQEYIAPPRAESSDGKIFITVSQSLVQRYKIEASLGGGTASGSGIPTLKSQYLTFDPGQIEERPPVAPIVKVDNVYVVPGDDALNAANKPQPQAIGFDIEWRAPKLSELETKLNRGNLYYELLLRDANNAQAQPKLIKIFTAEQTTGSMIQIKPYAGGAGGYAGMGIHYTANSTFLMPKVVLKAAEPIIPDSENWGWQVIEMPAGYLDGSAMDYPTINDIEVKDNLNNIVPGTYYLSMRTIFDSNAGGILIGDESNLMAISLDEINHIIPAPTPIDPSEKNTELPAQIAQDIFFYGSDITKYVDNMLEPANWHLYPKDSDEEDIPRARYQGNYEVFVYQEKPNTAPKKAFTQTDFDNAVKRAENADNLKEINSNNQVILSEDDLQELRDGNIIPIKYPHQDMRGSEILKLTLGNLDPNQVYHIQIRARLEPWKAGRADRIERSVLSKIHAFTTSTKPIPPTPDDKVPPAPKDFWIKDQPNNTTVILGWEKAEFMQEPESEEPYYEIVRIADKQLVTAQLNSKMSLERLVDEAETSYPLIGYSTSIEGGGYIRTYTKEGWSQADPQQSTTISELTDISLTPNEIYYYYIRTVCEIEGSLVRSQWIMVPVTTSPIEPPIQLKVETPKAYTYDAKTETVISFLAPVPRDADIPQEYDFEIAVQSEMDEEYRLNYRAVRLTSRENQELMPEGYTHFVYKITDLKPGKRYDIKVRVVDKTKPASNSANYPRSLYTDKVVARTEFDEDDQEIDNKFDEYLKRYDDEVEKLRRKPYWELDGENRYSVAYKYRESYINAEMAIQSIYELQTNGEMNRLTYYLPASMLDKASDFNVIISAALGNEAMNIRPYTLTTENEDIKEAVDELNRKRIEDYYIKIEFLKMTSSGTINGEEVISPEISIDMDIVYLEEEDIIIEDDIMIALNSLIDRERRTVINLLEKELDKGTINDDRLKDIIDEAVIDITSDHKKEVRQILRSETDKTVSINAIEKPILLVSILDSYAVNGYYLEGSWTSVEVLQANGGFAIEAQKLGVYAFTGKTGLNTAVPGLSAQQDIISKYNLEDFFVLDAYMIKTAASKKQVYGAVARVLGAKRNTDYMEFLRLREIKGITSIGLDKGIRQDEAVYVLMQTYEKLYNKPIGAINIKNRQSVTNIGAFQVPYRPYVYAAVELKIIQNPNLQVLPSKAMSAEEIIKMLSRIITR